LSEKKWAVVFQVFRQKGQTKPHFDSFTMDVDPEEYVLDVVERIWSFKDRSLVFRHACHHSTCGACGMRVNSVEKLTCITPVQAVTRNRGTVKVEPLRNFPVVSDLVVDMSVFYSRMEAAGNPQVVAVEGLPLGKGIRPAVRQLGPKPGLKPGQDGRELLRLVDCIECGMCISACPVALTDYAYLGPAVLAGIQSQGRLDSNSLNLADSQDGVWRCHSVYECSAVCPSFVEPAWRIMDLRRQTLARRIRAFFYPQKEVG